MHWTPEQQLERLKQRDSLNDAEAKQRLSSQWPIAKKQKLADRLIDNSGKPDHLKEQIIRYI